MPVPRSATPYRGQWLTGPALSRRQVGGGIALAVTAWLAGCSPPDSGSGEQADDARATTSPEANTQDPDGGEDPADVAILSATLAATRELSARSGAVVAESSGQEASAEVDRVLGIQAAVLSRLAGAGTSSREQRLAAADSDASTRTAASPGVEDLAHTLAEHSSAKVLTRDLGGVSAANIPTLMSLHGARRACVETLTGAVERPRLAGPTGPGAITALAGLRQCIYGLEILAARGAGQDREAYLEALRRLRGPTRQLTELAGTAAPAAPLGYGLSMPIDSVRERRALARQLVVAAIEAVVAGSAARASDQDAIEGTVQLVALTAGVGTTIRVPLTGFPGLDVPAEDLS